MLAQLLSDPRNVPESLRATRARLRAELDATRERLQSRTTTAQRWVKRRAFEASTAGADRLWKLHLDVLDGAGTVIEKASQAPVVDRIAASARDALHQLETRTTRPPIEGYDALNVREIRQALHDLDHLGLLRVRHFEAAHKQRKTVLDAVDREFEHRARVAAG